MEEESIVCPNCKHITYANYQFRPSFCSKCGTNIESKYNPHNNYCPKCAPNGPSNPYEDLELDEKFCPICGGKTILYDYIVSQKK